MKGIGPRFPAWKLLNEPQLSRSRGFGDLIWVRWPLVGEAIPSQPYHRRTPNQLTRQEVAAAIDAINADHQAPHRRKSNLATTGNNDKQRDMISNQFAEPLSGSAKASQSIFDRRTRTCPGLLRRAPDVHHRQLKAAVPNGERRKPPPKQRHPQALCQQASTSLHCHGYCFGGGSTSCSSPFFAGLGASI